MIRSKVVQEVAYRLGNRTDLNTRILTVMDLIQGDLLEKASILPWFLLSEDQESSTTATEERLPVPDTFIREYEGGALWRYDSTQTIPWVCLRKQPTDMLRRALGDDLSATGAPTHYGLAGKYFRLAPVPDAVYTMKIKTYNKDTLPSVVADGAENAWMEHAPEVLITQACIRMARQLRYRRDAVAQFSSDASDAFDTYWRDVEARIHANMTYEMGE